LQPAYADERRIALIVSNSAYAPVLPQLPNAHEDGAAIAASLRNVGFEVREARDVDQQTLREEILGFVRSLKDDNSNTVSFFYFSGHGAADRDMQGENFIIPVRSKIESAEELRARAVSLQEVIKSIEAVQVKASFVVLDACRNVPFPSGSKSLQKGFVPERRSGGMLIAYAAAPGETAPDNNVYAKALADIMQRPSIDAFTVFKDVQLEVARQSDRKQVPWTEDGLLAKIFFKDGAAGARRASLTLTPGATPARVPELPKPAETSSLRSPFVPLEPGGGAMTGFSGLSMSTPSYDGRPGINIDGPVLRMLKTTSLKSLTGETSDQRSASMLARAGDIGQVYGVAIDGGSGSAPGGHAPPFNIYVAATSAYGLPITARGEDGQPRSLARGASGAQWAHGLFGTSKDGGPGSIWKIDGTTGQASLFADIRLDGVRNSGPGLGQLAFDPRTRQLFVSDLDTGMIHRLSMKGDELGYWDHGVQGRPNRNLAPVADDKRRADITSSSFDPARPDTWGFTDKRRRIWGIVARADRLYYAVAEGPQIWSVGIKLDGTFAADARLELEVSGFDGRQITQIRFDREGNLFVALLAGLTVQHEHGPSASRSKATLLRFRRQLGSPDANPHWDKEPDVLPIGEAAIERAALFDLTYAQNETGDIDRANCRGALWTAGWKAQSNQRAQRQQVMLAWRIGDGNGLTAGVTAIGGEQAFAVLGSLALLAPCDRDEDVLGMPKYEPALPDVRAAPWDTAQPDPRSEAGAGPPQAGAASPVTTGPSGSPATTSTDASASAENQGPDTSAEVASATLPAITLPCARVTGQRFQCVGGAWELEVNMDDAAGRGLDALTVNPLTTDVLVFPSVQKRAQPSDPFRIRFDGVPSGNQIPLDVCLHDDAVAKQNVAFRCCRAQVVVNLPQVPCSPPSQLQTTTKKAGP
jgi:hypothetical protein